MINDHTHILTKWGDVVTVRGFCDDNEIYVVPVYILDVNGGRKLLSNNYTKSIDEFTDHYSIHHPDKVKKTVWGNRICISQNDIFSSFNPFENFDSIYKQIDNQDYKNIIDELAKIVPVPCIGFTGSRLLGCPKEDSDLDLVISSFNNYKKIRENFSKILSNLDATCSISQKQFDKSIIKYHDLFNEQFNSFEEMIYNRWSTIHIPDRVFCKIRFTYDSEIDNIPNINLSDTVKLGTILGTVIDSDGVNFMPRYFHLRDKDNREWECITYFWDYSFAVNNNDIVEITGLLDLENKRIVISNRREHGININNINHVFCKLI